MFNPSTIIVYNLPEPSHVLLTVYNLLGEEVRVLVSEEQTPGIKSVVWNGKNNAHETVTSGLYVYRIKAGNFVSTRKMIFMK